MNQQWPASTARSNRVVVTAATLVSVMNGWHAGGMRRVHDFGVSCVIRGVFGALVGSSSEVSDGDATLGWPWDAADRVFGPYAEGKNLKLKRRAPAKERYEYRHQRHQRRRKRVSKEERQPPIYQQLRDLREPQSKIVPRIWPFSTCALTSGAAARTTISSPAPSTRAILSIEILPESDRLSGGFSGSPQGHITLLWRCA